MQLREHTHFVEPECLDPRPFYRLKFCARRFISTKCFAPGLLGMLTGMQRVKLPLAKPTFALRRGSRFASPVRPGPRQRKKR